MRWLAIVLCVALPLVDLAWNLTHLNIGHVDFYGVTLPALGLVQNGAWPATPYYPAGYPLLLIPFGLLGSTLVGGYVLSTLGAVLALTGVRRLALELGSPEEWTLAAVALAWAEPTFRVTAGAPTPDMLLSGGGVWFLWSAVAIWKRSAQPPVWTLALTALVLPLLHYRAWVLVVPVVVALLAAGRLGNPLAFNQRPFDPAPARHAQVVIAAIVLGLLVNLVPYYIQNGHLMSSATGLQVRIGLEADQPTFFKDATSLFNGYGAFADFARRRSIIGDYGFTTIAKHALIQVAKFLRRPPVVLALLLFAVALLRRRLLPGEAPLAAWIVLSSLALGIAYYTPLAAVLVVLVGISLSFALVPRLLTQRTDLALGAACVLLLLAYWPAGKFARANLAERAHYAELSRQTAQRLQAQKVAPENHIAMDMRIIWPPAVHNPWQKPYLNMSETWLNDPAIRAAQLPGYSEEDRLAVP